MISTSILRRLSVLVCATFVLGACAETQFIMATAKRLDKQSSGSQGRYKVGKPYQIGGVWYYPKEDWTYDHTGIASWYGPNFHGKATANGEVFDQWAVTAAHKTLPMPSLVRVTNLENGRSLVVRINDRGPYKPGRIIDLSRRSAQLLDIESKGTAKVRVQVLTNESRALAERAKAGQTQLARADTPIQGDTVMAREPVVSQHLPAPKPAPASTTAPVAQAPITPAPVEVATTQPVTPVTTGTEYGTGAQGSVSLVPVAGTPRVYVQAGAFSNPDNAERVRRRLVQVGQVAVTPVEVNGRQLYRVRVGPLDNVTQADRTLAQVIDAGYQGARTIVD